MIVVADRGCDYGRDDQNMHYGHVKQVTAKRTLAFLFSVLGVDGIISIGVTGFLSLGTLTLATR